MMPRMNRIIPQFLRRPIVAIALGVAMLGTFAAASPAYSRVFVGFGFPLYFGPPAYYYPPPVYYPPPAYYPPANYPPPPASYAPPPASYAPTQSGQSCNAGAYVCPMDRPVSPGSSCYCLGHGGARVWGRAS